jgi:hypothetical protein
VKRFSIFGLAVSLLAASVGGQEFTYPIGTVIAPDGNNIPSREQQQFHYRWAARQGINAIEHEIMPVSGGYFDWAFTCPTRDTFNWVAYDGVVEDAEASNLDVYLEVFTMRGVPDWIADGRPELYMHTPLAGADTPTPVMRDSKLDINSVPSFAHPEYIAAVDKYVRAIAKRFKDRKRVRGYIIAEEIGLPGVWPAGNYYGIDFSPAMRDLFHARLKAKYGSVEAMNEAWGHQGRYKSFSEVVWRSGWSHSPKQFRGEWMEYYQALQQAYADHHNRVARAIKEEDPDALIMVSDFQPMVNRVGHGAHAALFTEIDAFGFKSYWNDTRMQADFTTGIVGGKKQLWCTNFSEAATTRGENKRFMNSEYVRRQFWPAYARGLDGLFLFNWMPQQMEMMSLLDPSIEGSLDTIAAIQTVRTLREFMDAFGKELSAYRPEAPSVVVHDPNLTFIAQHWDYADPTKVREKWFSETPATAAYQTSLDDLAALNRRFTISTESTLADQLSNPATKLLIAAGTDVIDPDAFEQIERWIESGRPIVVDERTGKFDTLSREVNKLQQYHGRENVLTLLGDRWDRDPAQRARLAEFVSKHVPLRYSSHNAAGPEVFTVDYMFAEDGSELAIITRRGPQGRPENGLNITLDWRKPHATLKVLDPFATVSRRSATVQASHPSKPVVQIEGFQDVLIVIGR